MADQKPNSQSADEYKAAAPVLQAAREQIAAARKRRELLIAAGRLPASFTGDLAPLPSKALPGYTLLRELHRGGQGVVYLAIQQTTGRQVAVKLLRHGPLAKPADLARFEREIDILGALKHPNVVTIHDCGRSDDDLYLVMDYVEGRPLDGHLAHERPSIRETLALFAQVCDGVNAAHLRGVIHRDLKPSNIRVDIQSRPQVLDFGLAKLTKVHESSSAAAMTITGEFVGSLPWASPEQAAGASDQLDIRTDVYSLGVILYQLLTGQFPYSVSGRIDEVVHNIVQTEPHRPSTQDKAIDNDVETILLKCLAKEPERRYQSAGELARDIRHYLDNEPIEAKRDSMAYVLRKQLVRHWIAVAVASSFVLLLAGGLVTSLTLLYRTDQALTEKEVQRRLADQRADENQRIADFQSSLLSEINIQTAGVGLRHRLLAKRRTALETLEGEPGRVDAGLAELEQSLAGVNFTSVALETLEEMTLRRGWHAVDEQFADQPLVGAQLLQSLADTYRSLGLFDGAIEPQEEALRIRRTTLGDEHPDTLASVHALGLLLQAKGNLDQALPFLAEAADKRRNVLGSEHVDTLTSIHDLGVLLKLQGKLAEAHRYYEEALAARRRVLGDDHVNTLTSLSDMGVLLRELGRLPESERYYAEALERKRRVLGDDHPNTLTSIANLGHLFSFAGKYSEAEFYFRDVLERRRRVLGDMHPETLSTVNDLGYALQAQGRLAEAQACIREALEARRATLGDDHPDTLMSVSNIAAMLIAEGKSSEAEPYLLEVLEKRRRMFGPDHPRTLFSLTNMGVFLHNQGRLEEAEPYLREAVERHRRALGDEHPGTLHAFVEMGSLLQDQGNVLEAEVYYRLAMEGNRRVLGDDHPDTLASINRVAGILLILCDPANAEPLFREVLEGRLATVPPRAAEIAITRIGLGLALVELARETATAVTTRTTMLSEAEAMFQEAWDILGPDPRCPANIRKRMLGGFVDLYTIWRDIEPDQGFDLEAVEWSEKLSAWQASLHTAEP